MIRCLQEIIAQNTVMNNTSTDSLISSFIYNVKTMPITSWSAALPIISYQNWQQTVRNVWLQVQ